jgi:hypothetical protein
MCSLKTGKYSVVEFPAKEDGGNTSVEVISSSWLSRGETRCLWPQRHQNIPRLAEQNRKPDRKTWEKCNILRVLTKRGKNLSVFILLIFNSFHFNGARIVFCNPASYIQQ